LLTALANDLMHLHLLFLCRVDNLSHNRMHSERSTNVTFLVTDFEVFPSLARTMPNSGLQSVMIVN
ncbi:hypothetical protein T4C_627, partial [Trichinella pseudospiralis]